MAPAVNQGGQTGDASNKQPVLARGIDRIAHTFGDEVRTPLALTLLKRRRNAEVVIPCWNSRSEIGAPVLGCSVSAAS